MCWPKSAISFGRILFLVVALAGPQCCQPVDDVVRGTAAVGWFSLRKRLRGRGITWKQTPEVEYRTRDGPRGREGGGEHHKSFTAGP